MPPSYFIDLNRAQLQAVEHPPDRPLQILAGPGSGKTRVLTCRIAHLITHHAVQPSTICAVTFTNKAAGEMRLRLEKLLGKGQTDQIRMGTFHSLCAKFLRRHADKVGIQGNFTICDAEESKKVVKKLLDQRKEVLEGMEATLDAGIVSSKISKAKAKGLFPRDIFKEVPAEPVSHEDWIAKVVAEIYEEYQYTLRKCNSLDFDDLLVRGVQLFRDYPEVANWCKHILVDEFQDTNTMQYELMKFIAAAHKCVTIVGDPDQSIYGWRSAEVENLRKMTREFPSVCHILLEQNYRSTGAILAASVAIVAEDKNRIPKTLFTSHPIGSLPLLSRFEDGRDESAFIAMEIKRLIAYSGGMLNYNDFSILLRYSSLSCNVERELQKASIPNRILGGRKFFDRIEIKDLLAYLQLVDNPQYAPAFLRVINVPPRAIGAKTVEKILTKATQFKISPLEVVEHIHDGKISDTTPTVKKKIKEFVEAIKLLREQAEQHCSASILIPKLVQIIDYAEHLKKTHKDHEERWLNVEELMNFAAEMELHGTNHEIPAGTEDDLMEDTPLRAFLQASMLSTNADTSDDDKSPKVTVATCHAAKGLEWPVVFIPAVENGVFPASRAEEEEEERRLLYVACTRAQNYLTISHCASRFVAGQEVGKSISPFISCLQRRQEVLFRREIPKVDDEELQLASTILGRPLPDEGQVARKIQEFNAQRRNKPNLVPTSSTAKLQSNQPRTELGDGAEASGLPSYRGPVRFTTASATLRQSGYKPVPRKVSVTGRAPLLSSADQIVNGASRTEPKNSVLKTQAESRTVIDLRSPSPKPIRRRSPPVARNNKPVAVSGSAAPRPSRSPTSDMVIDLRSPSPELVARPAVRQHRSEPTRKRITAESFNVHVPSYPSEPIQQRSCLQPNSGTSSEILRITPEAHTLVDFVPRSGPSASSASTDAKPTTTRKRLGMGRTATGYPNKKFKAPS